MKHYKLEIVFLPMSCLLSKMLCLLFIPAMSGLPSAPVANWGLYAAGGMGAQGGPRRSRPIPGEDERYDIQLEFLDAVFGTQYVAFPSQHWPVRHPYCCWVQHLLSCNLRHVVAAFLPDQCLTVVCIHAGPLFTPPAALTMKLY